MHFLGVVTPQIENVPTHGGIYKSEKIQQTFWEMKP